MEAAGWGGVLLTTYTKFTFSEFRVCVRAGLAFWAGYKLGERYKLGELEERRGRAADPDETGIIVAGKDAQGRGYVLADLSGHYTPIEWARIAVAAYKGHGADRVVAETNNGGEMVEATLRVVDDNIAYSAVHATRGKIVRAEPVAALYEQGRIKHMAALPTLEDQMCEFTPDLDRSRPKRDSTNPASAGRGGAHSSPDRADALVWAFTELLVEEIGSWGIYETTRRKAEALVKERLAAAEAGRPKTEYAPGSMEYQALHPDWKPQEESY